MPGAEAARRPALTGGAGDALRVPAEYPHEQPGFAFDLALRDMARTIDVPTAQWRAKTLEYPASGLTALTGPAWPWGATLLPLLYVLAGLTVIAVGRLALQAWHAGRPSAGAGPAAPLPAPNPVTASDPATDPAPEPAGRQRGTQSAD